MALAALVALAAGTPVPAGAQERRPAGRPSYANPSAVIAAELAFARDAGLRGQWTAFAAAAAPDAVMFVPQMVWAQQWLMARANPPAALRWQPYALWSSCDGSLVVSHGAWQAGANGSAGQGTSGWFTTLWQRQPDGAYKWVLDHGDDGPAGTEPEMIAAQVADCPAPLPRGDGGDRPPIPGRLAKPVKPPKPIAPKDLPPLDPVHRAGAAGDGSLRWEVTVAPDLARTLTIRWTRDGAEQALLTERVAAPAAAR